MRKLLLMFVMICLATSAFAEKPNPDKTYTIKYAKTKPEFKGDWDAYWNSPAWQQAETASIDSWSTVSTETRPKTQVKVLYDETGVRLLWKVEDSFVVARAQKYGDSVFRDSTVEFFFEPTKAQGYANIETNAGGIFIFHVQRPEKGQDVNVKYPPKYHRPVENVVPEVGTKIQVRKSLAETIIYPPIEKPTTWYLEMFIPIEVLDKEFGIKDLNGANWRGNFYKIIEDQKDPKIVEHNHYGAWAPIGSKVNFHQPAVFGNLRFEKQS